MPRHAMRRRLILAVRPLLLACLIVGGSAAAAEWRWQGVPKVVAVSDVHGAAAALARTVQAAGLIDDAQQWQGDNSHLVITGDLLDRGADSRAAMDLIMRLEEEAQLAGGRVHLLLGNHEVMNLVGDLRYVTREEYAAFAADETAAERELWFRRFAARHGGEETAALREQFDRARPAGFFAHRRAFSPDGRYGAWLLQKPLLVVINDTAFVHGGLSPDVSRLGVEQINSSMQDELRNYVAALDALYDAGLLLPGDNFYSHRQILETLPAEDDRSPDIVAALQVIQHDADHSIHDVDGPLWYRGNVGCPAIVEAPRLSAALAAVGAGRLVVGHSPTDSRNVVSKLDGRLFEIDTGMQNAYYGGRGHAFIMDGDSVAVVDETGNVSAVGPDSRLNAAAGKTDAELEQLLREAPLVAGEAEDDGSLPVTMVLDETTLMLRFTPLEDSELPAELLAYRIDRLLGLQMVPVTVTRTLNGQPGLLQLRPANPVNELARSEAGAGASAWCPLPVQWQSMYLFDALIYKESRSAEQILYDRGNWRLVLTGHGNAFGTRRGRPPYLANAELTVTDAWRERLGRLDEEWLVAASGDQLDRRQRKALLRRRDELLRLP